MCSAVTGCQLLLPSAVASCRRSLACRSVLGLGKQNVLEEDRRTGRERLVASDPLVRPQHAGFHCAKLPLPSSQPSPSPAPAPSARRQVPAGLPPGTAWHSGRSRAQPWRHRGRQTWLRQEEGASRSGLREW